MSAASGKSLIALGLVELLSRRSSTVGFFRPIVAHAPDSDLELIRARYQIPDDRIGYAFTTDEYRRKIADDGEAAAVSHAIAAYKAIEAVSDIVVVEGTDFTGPSSPVEAEVNAHLARHLGAPVVAVVNGHRRSVDDIVEAMQMNRETYGDESIIAMIVNRADRTVRDALVDKRGDNPSGPPVWMIPDAPVMRQPSFEQLTSRLGAQRIAGADDDFHRQVSNVKVAAMSVANVLEHVHDGTVLITPGDRSDVMLAAALSRQSESLPSVTGMILTGGLEPDKRVCALITGAGGGKSLPLVLVDADSYDTAVAVASIEGAITADDDRKVQTGLALFEEHVDLAVLAERIQLARSTTITPIMFQHDLIERAKAARRHIVLPEGGDDRILEAADRVVRRRVCDLTILGDVGAVRKRAGELGLELGDTRVVDPMTSEHLEPFARRYTELRAHKGVAFERALDLLTDVSYFGTMMVHEGVVDGMVSGAAHTTGHTIRPALEFIKTKPGVSIVSSCFLMLLADRVLVYGDCAVNPDPTAEQLADIAISSAETGRLFGVEPRIAMLSYSTGESGSGADVDKVRQATARVRELRPDLPVAGPIQYDAAVDAEVGRSKLPGSDVAGRATVFIFPDLNTGNNTYKAVQRSAQAIAVGPVLQGLNKPVNDLSRGALIPDIVNTVAITAIQAGGT